MASIEDPQDCDRYEVEHVHRIYEDIAPHFSATRFKPWPVVDRFLRELPAGSVGLDVGCGNGKYLTVNPNLYLIGSDRSSNLIDIAYNRKVQDSFVADGLDLPHPQHRFDFAISIAVIHHFSSSERRRAAVKSILDALKRPVHTKPAGKALIFVWALEQKTSRRGWDEGDQQDVFVPWVMSKKFSKHDRSGLDPSPVTAASTESLDRPRTGKEGRVMPVSSKLTYQRYYHLYRKGELEADIRAAGGTVLEIGYERDNWWAICGPLH